MNNYNKCALAWQAYEDSFRIAVSYKGGTVMPTKYPTEFKRKIIHRYEKGESIKALSHELNIYKENRHPEPTDFIGEDACSFIKTEKNN